MSCGASAVSTKTAGGDGAQVGAVAETNPHAGGDVVSRGHFIGLNHHRLMLADRVRMEAYERAIEARVRPGM